MDSAVVPFVARNQGRWTDSDQAFAAFERAFPNNSPGFFCFAAMQGLAQAVGMSQLAAIKSCAHPACDPAAGNHFANACASDPGAPPRAPVHDKIRIR